MHPSGHRTFAPFSWRRSVLIVTASLLPTMVLAQRNALPAGPAGDLVRDGRKLAGQGKHEEAVAQFAKALEVNPAMFEASLASGTSLDLLGRYADARRFLARAIEVASPEQKGTALRNMAFSYAFERDCRNAEKFAQQAYALELAVPDYNSAAEVANELGRLCLESGDVKVAEAWYKLGYENALKQPVLADSARDLWNFRWHNALARIAARRGDKAQAIAHVGHAKGFLDKGTNPGQLSFMPYLSGYVAFHTGDFAGAIADLKQAQQNDPFVLALLAQSFEKTGDAAAAMELWRKVLTMNFHNPTNAYARPLARARVGH